MKIGKGSVVSVPPNIQVILRLIITRVTVENIVKYEVVGADSALLLNRTRLGRETPSLLTQALHIQGGTGVRADVDSGGPITDVKCQQDIGSVLIAEMQQSQVEALIGVGKPADVRIAGTGYGCSEIRRVVAGVCAMPIAMTHSVDRLLYVTTQIRLNMYDGRLTESGILLSVDGIGVWSEPLHEFGKILKVRLH